MEFERVLREEIRNEVEELKKIELGTEEYTKTVDGVTKLMDRVIEMEKLNLEFEDKIEERENDNKMKLKQMREDRKARIMKDTIDIAAIVIPTAVTIWGVVKSFEFEKEGTITTPIGRGFINKLLPRK